MANILELINNDKWADAISKLDDLFSPIFEGKNLFHYACMRGNEKIINKYIEFKLDNIYHTDDFGNTGAHLLAINHYDKLLIQIVMNNPTFLKLKNNDDDFIYNIVVTRRKTFLDIIEIMKKHNLSVHLDYVREDNRTILLDIIDILTLDAKYYDVLEKMNELKVNFNLPNESPPLLYAISKKLEEIAIFMIDKLKVNVNIISTNQYSALILALKNGLVKVVDKLLDCDIDVNFAGAENRFVPMSLCLKFGYIDMAKKMIKSGKIDFNKKNDSLNTPIYYLIINIADGNTSKDINELLRIFIEHSDLTNINFFNITPFQLLVKHNLWQNNVDILKNKNIDINLVDRSGISALSYVKSADMPKFIKLTEKNIKLNKQISIDEKKTVVLPDILNSDNSYGVFNADSVHNIMYLMYILLNYKQCTIPMRLPLEEIITWEAYTTGLQLAHHDGMTNMLISIATFYISTFYSLSPMIIFWRDKYCNYENKNLNLYLSRAINSDYRFVVMRVTLIVDKSLSHANLVIYDKKSNRLVRFEPYGDWEFLDCYYLDNKLVNMFKKAISDKSRRSTMKYVRPENYLNRTKFQTLSLGDHYEFKNLGDPEGYCLAWCYWFLELKLKNPDMNEKTLVENALDEIIKIAKPNDDNPLLNYIRNYAKHLDNEKNNALKSMGIGEHDLYRLSYDSEKLATIRQYVNKYVVHEIKNMYTQFHKKPKSDL